MYINLGLDLIERDLINVLYGLESGPISAWLDTGQTDTDNEYLQQLASIILCIPSERC